MDLTELDQELLELLALETPWNIVCAEFHERFGSPGVLARRLVELYHDELITIRPTVSGEQEISPAALEADALMNACYAGVEGIGASKWAMVATDQGFKNIEHRLRAE